MAYEATTTAMTEMTDSESIASDAAQQAEGQQEAIPEELDGISEETARSIMEEAKAAGTQEGDREPDADAGSEIKPDEAPYPLDMPKGKVPYERFYHVVEKNRKLEEELEKLRGQAPQPQQGSQQPAQPQYQPMQQPQMPAQPQIRLNPEAMRLFKEATDERAMQMTGFTKEDVDSLEYGDEDDARKAQWEQARSIAQSSVYADVRAAMERQQQQAAAEAQQRSAYVNSYNDFYQAALKEPDFEGVRDHAINKFFLSLPPQAQGMVAQAYERVERNTASPQDIFVVLNYYDAARRDYRSSHPLPKEQAGSIEATAGKLAAADKHPRSGQVSGEATSGSETVTAAALEKMLREDDWDKIPEQYRKMLLRGEV